VASSTAGRGNEDEEVVVIDRNMVSEGMMVRSSDGKKLGRVLACMEGRFIVEKGCFFATDYLARYDDVSDVEGDEIHLARAEEELVHGQRTVPRECGMGESLTVGLGSGLDVSPHPWARAEEEEDDVRRGGVRGDEGGSGTRYDMGGSSGASPTSYGDEGGSGR